MSSLFDARCVLPAVRCLVCVVCFVVFACVFVCCVFIVRWWLFVVRCSLRVFVLCVGCCVIGRCC